MTADRAEHPAPPVSQQDKTLQPPTTADATTDLAATLVPPPSLGAATGPPRTDVAFPAQTFPGDGGAVVPNVPGYEILGELGRGGMGVVYKARQIALDRFVALKMILSGGHAGSQERTRFRTEAEAVARLAHPNIVQVHEVGAVDGLPYLALEFCPGGSLEERLKGTPLPPHEAARLVATLAAAIQAAHEAGVVHRDLKPANVLLAADGSPKITDFGLAKKLDEVGQTASGAVMGTPSYMAPEQASGKNRTVGPEADVWALGAVLYELLTGRPPFKAATAIDTIVQVVTDDPVSPARLQSQVPRDLATVCLKCLHKEPQKRYASAANLAADLHRFLEGKPVAARPAGAAERAVKWARRRPAAAALLAVSVAAALSLLTVGLTFTRQLRTERDTAQEERDTANDERARADRERRRAERSERL